MFKIRQLPLGLMLLVSVQCDTYKHPRGQNLLTEEINPIKVAAVSSVPGFSKVSGEYCGFSYELINAFVNNQSKPLELTTGESLDRLWGNLESNKADVGMTPTARVAPGALSLPAYSTHYVMLGKSSQKLAENFNLSEAVAEGRVMMTVGFEETKSYGMVMDSLCSAQLFVSSRDAVQLAAEAAKGEYDFLICEKSEAVIARSSVRGMKEIYSFDEEVGMSFVFSPANPALFYQCGMWLEEFRNTDEFARMSSYYMGRDADGRKFQRANNCTISVWDDLIKEVGEREGVDWRLLSAIAYKESRFQHDLTSKRGAKGLMQIMPVTARHFKVDQAALADPEVNITLAAKLIKSIEKSLKFAPNTPREDKLSIILAGYNCGVGTVSDARKLAMAEGKNPDSWETISEYLRLMGDSSYKCETVNYRKFRGCGETLAFVDGVKEQYDSYRRMVN